MAVDTGNLVTSHAKIGIVQNVEVLKKHSGWKDLGGAFNADGKFSVNASAGGSFVLVSK